MLRIANGHKHIDLPAGGRLDILRQVSLTVNATESVAIQGRSGSGKSTLLGVLGLLDELDEGSYTISGREVSKLSGADAARMRGTEFGFVFQRFCLMGHLNAIQNVEAPLVQLGWRARDRRRRANEVLELVGLTARGKHRPGQLSGGEQQRVALARAIVHRPAIILADEPTGSLDQETGEVVLGLLTALPQDLGATLILVTHDPAIAAAMDRTIRLDHGQVMA